MNTEPSFHFADNYLLRLANPITVNIIGVGETGSHALYRLGKTDKRYSLMQVIGNAIKAGIAIIYKIQTVPLFQSFFNIFLAYSKKPLTFH